MSGMKKLWWIAPLTLAVVAAAGWLLLRTPGPLTLELYDVQDLTCRFTDMPGVDLPLARNPSDDDPLSLTGMELAQRIRFLLPGSNDGKGGERIDFSNGLIIARTTGIQQAAVFGIIAAHRSCHRWLTALHSHD